jgi:hypothetical protein
MSLFLLGAHVIVSLSTTLWRAPFFIYSDYMDLEIVIADKVEISENYGSLK